MTSVARLLRYRTWFTAGGLLVAVACSSKAARAQQYVTDDAAVTEDRACQVQMWHGQRASWVLPVCTPLHHLELSVGFIAVWQDGADGHFEYVAQAKTVGKAVTPGGWGYGFVVGTGRDPGLAGTRNQTYTVYSYVPLSVSLGDDRLVLHENTGWLYARNDQQGASALTWAARADARLRAREPRLVAVAEVYGAEGAARAPAEFQAGLRTWPRRDHVQIDVSYGGRLSGPRAGREGAGWTFGLTLITPPFL